MTTARGTPPYRVDEATTLYQIADVDATKLTFPTFPATGRLYDGFVPERRGDDNFLIERDKPMIAARTCDGATGPDGGECVARAK